MNRYLSKENFFPLSSPAASDLERKLEKAFFESTNLEAPLEFLWRPLDLNTKQGNIEGCNARFLPFLAWGLGVSVWSSEWSDDEKRRIIAKFLYIRRIRGSLESLVVALDALHFKTEIVEWFEDNDPQKPYTFKVNLKVKNNEGWATREEGVRVIKRLIEDFSPVYSKYDLKIIYEVTGKLHICPYPARVIKLVKMNWDFSHAEE